MKQINTFSAVVGAFAVFTAISANGAETGNAAGTSAARSQPPRLCQMFSAATWDNVGFRVPCPPGASVISHSGSQRVVS